ncbi:hypothetical protein ACI0FM_01555 [Paenochrobactrum sp. BZR 588]|uniref:hypothetical protein n=1 Tax=Paenochrobactrum TaxID=999488 RepID=UPI0035BC3FA2
MTYCGFKEAAIKIEGVEALSCAIVAKYFPVTPEYLNHEESLVGATGIEPVIS